MPTEVDVFGEWTPDVIEVKPPKSKVVHLRCPSYGEWHRLAVAHQQLGGKSPDASLIAETLATCVCDKDGKRMLSDAKAGVLLNASPRAVLWLYKKCWETVLRNDDDIVAEMEKNSEAGQD